MSLCCMLIPAKILLMMKDQIKPTSHTSLKTFAGQFLDVCCLSEITIWDRFARLFHWSVAGAFLLDF